MRHERPDHTLQPTALIHEVYFCEDRGLLSQGRGYGTARAAASTTLRRVQSSDAAGSLGVAQALGVNSVTASASVAVSRLVRPRNTAQLPAMRFQVSGRWPYQNCINIRST